jgi:two-component system phosphate regulon sensor histidine kinase PhoR
VGKLDSLLSDLLTLSQVEERAPLGQETQFVDLGDLATRTAAAFEAAYVENQIALEVAACPAKVPGDPVYLETVARNLLDNALHYSDAGSRVLVEVCEEGPWAVLRVKDTGLGIPRDAQERVFERFYRVDQARSRDTGGTGLGLSIVRHIVEQHGGTVELESAVGVGSTFTVRLPLAQIF